MSRRVKVGRPQDPGSEKLLEVKGGKGKEMPIIQFTWFCLFLVGFVYLLFLASWDQIGTGGAE